MISGTLEGQKRSWRDCGPGGERIPRQSASCGSGSYAITPKSFPLKIVWWPSSNLSHWPGSFWRSKVPHEPPDVAWIFEKTCRPNSFRLKWAFKVGFVQERPGYIFLKTHLLCFQTRKDVDGALHRHRRPVWLKPQSRRRSFAENEQLHFESFYQRKSPVWHAYSWRRRYWLSVRHILMPSLFVH